MSLLQRVTESVTMARSVGWKIVNTNMRKVTVQPKIPLPWSAHPVKEWVTTPINVVNATDVTPQITPTGIVLREPTKYSRILNRYSLVLLLLKTTRASWWDYEVLVTSMVPYLKRSVTLQGTLPKNATKRSRVWETLIIKIGTTNARKWCGISDHLSRR